MNAANPRAQRSSANSQSQTTACFRTDKKKVSPNLCGLARRIRIGYAHVHMHAILFWLGKRTHERGQIIISVVCVPLRFVLNVMSQARRALLTEDFESMSGRLQTLRLHAQCALQQTNANIVLLCGRPRKCHMYLLLKLCTFQ